MPKTMQCGLMPVLALLVAFIASATCGNASNQLVVRLSWSIARRTWPTVLLVLYV